MIVMPSNNTGSITSTMFKQYPGRLAHLQSADSLREPKFGHKWALDNGVYGAFTNEREWSEKPFYDFLEKYGESHSCEWAVVPDWVGDCKKTLRLWNEHAERVLGYGVPLALAVQDGMTHEMVRALKIQPTIIFIGGSTSWKLRTLNGWCAAFDRVHVARVNTEIRLWQCHRAKAESVDGTGWFKFGKERVQELDNYLSQSTSGICPQLEMNI